MPIMAIAGCSERDTTERAHEIADANPGIHIMLTDQFKSIIPADRRGHAIRDAATKLNRDTDTSVIVAGTLTVDALLAGIWPEEVEYLHPLETTMTAQKSEFYRTHFEAFTKWREHVEKNTKPREKPSAIITP